MTELNRVFSAHGSEKLARMGELAINTPENKRAIACCIVGVTPSVKTTEILPSLYSLSIFSTYPCFVLVLV